MGDNETKCDHENPQILGKRCEVRWCSDCGAVAVWEIKPLEPARYGKWRLTKTEIVSET